MGCEGAGRRVILTEHNEIHSGRRRQPAVSGRAANGPFGLGPLFLAVVQAVDESGSRWAAATRRATRAAEGSQREARCASDGAKQERHGGVGGGNRPARSRQRCGEVVRYGWRCTGLLAGGDESGFVCEHNGLDSVAEAELGKDPRDVGSHGRLGHDQLLGDLGV